MGKSVNYLNKIGKFTLISILCFSAFLIAETQEQKTIRFAKEYGFKISEIEWGKQGKYPLVLEGKGSVLPAIDPAEPIIYDGKVDVVIPGTGLSGLAAIDELSRKGLKVVGIERNANPGGLASGEKRRGYSFGDGAAYLSKQDEGVLGVEYRERLGMTERVWDELEITEPVDSYLWQKKNEEEAKLYKGVWESNQTMKELPASFSLFRYVLRWLERQGTVAEAPLEINPNTAWIDKITMSDLIRKMPAIVETLAKTNKKAKQLLDRFQRDVKNGKIRDAKDPMLELIQFLDLYGRSALGEHADKLSAAAFLNFYSSEIGPRYTGQKGTGEMATRFLKHINKNENVELKMNSEVVKIIEKEDHVETYYKKDGKMHRIDSDHYVFAAPLTIAEKVIENFDALAPKHADIAKNLEFRHYLVLNLHTQNPAWVTESYDTWLRNDNSYTKNSPTDVILGQWMKQKGKPLQENERGELTLYIPLDKSAVENGFTDALIKEQAERAITELEERLKPLFAKKNEKLEILGVQVNRWPFSIHVTSPGYFSKAASLRDPIGKRGHFANNNTGVPAVEQAILEGLLGAGKILNEKGLKGVLYSDLLPHGKKGKPNKKCFDLIDSVKGSL